MIRIAVNSRSARRRESLVGCEHIGHEGKQVVGDVPFEPVRVDHGIDKADGAVLGQNVEIPETVASDRKPAKRAPLRIPV
jgi:hypothetical protein